MKSTKKADNICSMYKLCKFNGRNIMPVQKSIIFLFQHLWMVQPLYTITTEEKTDSYKRVIEGISKS